MKYTIEELDKMLNEIELWPVIEVGADKKKIDCHDIICDLVIKVKDLNVKLFLQESETKKYLYGYKELEKENKIIVEALSFYGDGNHIDCASGENHIEITCESICIEDGSKARKAMRV